MLFYLFILLLYVKSEKNQLLNSFFLMIGSLFVWTSGSFLMRGLANPGYIFWFHISLLGLFLSIISIYNFLMDYVGIKKTIFEMILMGILILLPLVNIEDGWFIKSPVMVNDHGNIIMIYEDISELILIPICLGLLLALSGMIRIGKKYKEDKKFISQSKPIFLGIAFFVLGNLLVVLPIFKSFPIDILFGLVNAIILIYALIRKDVLNFTFIASDANGYFVSVLLSIIIANRYIGRHIIETINTENLQSQLTMLLVIFLSSLIFIQLIWKKIVIPVVKHEAIYFNECLNEFSAKVAYNLNTNSIIHEVIEVFSQLEFIELVSFGKRVTSTNYYEIIESSKFTLNNKTIMINNGTQEFLGANHGLVGIHELMNLILYKSAWEEEKLQLRTLQMDYIAGINYTQFLLFIKVIQGKKFKIRDLEFLNSILSIADVSLRNAVMYEKVYLESRIDELTGIYNRKMFYEKYDEAFISQEISTTGLVLINIDDFKLFNQLYGVQNGDSILKEIAEIIRIETENKGMVFRYSGKEFIILLPSLDVYSSKQIVEQIKSKMNKLGLYSSDFQHRTITASIGISVYPLGASSKNELLQNVEMAVHQVKKNGKNGVMVFDTYEKGITEDLDYSKVYENYSATVCALTAAIDAKDHYTFNHSNNVAEYAVKLAKEIKLNNVVVEIVRQASLLHDIGKISIPENILNKPGALTDSEYEIMKRHVEASIEIIRHLPDLDYLIPAVIGHHERYDGKGYPRKISGENIPLTARILCICDAYDAMKSKRVYKEEISNEKIISIIKKESGRHFDPILVEAFINVLETSVTEFD
ncbi:diguanylate cyclase [Fusibacter bizertensis]|uniref:Diguanylate cyclase n=1 Tax=Fusibacter bizertensis TaxID=1488331 RepID=A0ABT6NF72_9FIRM|nr:HD domain-containing phosphohydrolase [Fusibacter bizertensis]MDH8679015.1 diguanylate cyclase [Fusibacter bizertensis]